MNELENKQRLTEFEKQHIQAVLGATFEDRLIVEGGPPALGVIINDDSFLKMILGEKWINCTTDINNSVKSVTYASDGSWALDHSDDLVMYWIRHPEVIPQLRSTDLVKRTFVFFKYAGRRGIILTQPGVEYKFYPHHQGKST